MPLLPHCLVAAQSLALLASPPAAVGTVADTIRLEVGSPEVDGRIYAPHAARVIVRVGAPDGPQRAEWTNELTLGDSAGRPVMRWVTRGTQTPLAGGAPVTWELHQTYDAVTLAPYGFLRRASNGAHTQLTIDGRRVRGTTRTPADSAPRPVDYELERLGFVASASDLVPLAVRGMKEGTVMTAPLWSPGQPRPEVRVFSVIQTVPDSQVTYAGGVRKRLVYFHDPEGNLLELCEYATG